MASKWAGISDRIRIAPRVWGGLTWRGPLRPPGTTSGRWISMGPVWIRLGSRGSWQGEDMDAQMITPVEPPHTRKHET